MKKKRAPEYKQVDDEGIDTSRVVLKPLAGIQPRVYVAVLYSLFIAGILFYIFLYPGLSHPGSEVKFTSLPEEASVLVDGVRIGATPVTAFVSRGNHVITVRRPYFEERNVEINVEGRIFGSRFFPKRTGFFTELSARSIKDILYEGHREFTLWAASGEPSNLHSVPPVLTAAVRDYTIAAKENSGEELFAMLAQAAASIAFPANFQDFIHATFLACANGTVMTPAAFTQAAAWFFPLYAKNPEVLYWLILVLPDKAKAEFLASSWVKAQLKKLEQADSTRPGRVQPRLPHMILGAQYTALSSGTFRMGSGKTPDTFTRITSESALRRLRENPPYTQEVHVDAFDLAVNKVSQAEYAAFLRENPQWLPSNRAVLTQQGLAEDSYLESWDNSPIPPRPLEAVSEVSYYAAAAYCDWLGRKFNRYNFFLPTETQWEYAAINGALGLNLEVGVWEWCSSWYAPAAYIFQSGESRFPAAEKAVRCGSSGNSRISAITRGSQPPDWCSPYLGFRIAAKEK